MTDIQIKHYDKTAWVELYPKTKARITELNSGKTVEAAIGELVSSLSSKVDKVSGKGLSTNDFTTTLQNKLNALPANAYTKAEVDTKIDNLTGSAIPVQSTPPAGASMWFETL